MKSNPRDGLVCTSTMNEWMTRGSRSANHDAYESFATVGEIRVWWRADFQSGSRVLKKVF